MDIETPSNQQFIKNKHGKFRMVDCHRLPNRSFHWKGKPILCYRCLGLDVGIIFMFMLQLFGKVFGQFNPGDWLFYIANANYSLIVLIIFLTQVPFILDGLLQAILNQYESKNPIRLITGILGGIGQYYMIFMVGVGISILLG